MLKIELLLEVFCNKNRQVSLSKFFKTMKFEQPQSIDDLLKIIDAKIVGDTSLVATGINEIHKVELGDISFVDSEKYYKKVLDSAASIIIINKEVPCPISKALLVCDNPFEAYVKIVKTFRAFKPQQKMISDDLEVGAATMIQPGVFIGNNVRIGSNCIIHANVTIYDFTIIGDNVEIHAGAVIGADAFYYNRNKQRDVQYHKMLSCGRVVIHDDVEIGAGTTIDKGVSGDTIIGSGTKIDNHVHIGHGAVIGKNCLFAAQVGIGGKAIIEDEVILWGQVGVSKDLTIGKAAIVNGQAGVTTSIEGDKIYFGTPADEARTKLRELVNLKKLPELIALLSK